MTHDDGATIRLAAALVRAYDDGEGHIVISIHPETLRETALAAKRETARLRSDLARVTEERDVARAEASRLREALELAEVEVALDRSWCRICRTEGRGSYRGRGVHPHERRCVLARLDAAYSDARKGGE